MRNRTIRSLLYCFLGLGLSLAVSVGAQGTPCSGDYDCALSALEAGGYDAAARTLEGLVEREPSAAAYQVLAKAYAADQRAIDAIWAFRSGEALGGTSASKDLGVEIYRSLPANLVPLSSSGLDWVARRANRLPFSQLCALLALVLTALFGGVAVVNITSKRPRSSSWLAQAFVLLSAACICLWVAFRQNALAHPAEAVLVVDPNAPAVEVPLFSAPSQGAAPVRELPPGAVVETGERLSGHTAVVLPTGESGWLPTERLRVVAPLIAR